MRILIAGLALGLLWGSSALAALGVGDTAPDFTAKAAVGGKVFTFHLAEALQKGPVVLYFYPKSFTSVCTEEAHDFADRAEDFTAAGATLIGLSVDTIDTQIQFSSLGCRDKFPVAADPDGSVAKSFEALTSLPVVNLAKRISFVIAPDGKIIYSYEDRAAAGHIENTLRALRAWRDTHKS